MHPPQLRGTEMAVASSGAGVRPLLSEELVWDERGELIQQGIGSGHREQPIHARKASSRIRLRPHRITRIIF